MRHLIFTHAHCADGAAAALALWGYLTGLHGLDAVQVVPCSYGDGKHLTVPVGGAAVFFADYCVPPADLQWMASQAASVVVLDHHRSAERMLTAETGWYPPNLTVRFDMGRSGAALAWAWTQEDRVRRGEAPIADMPALYAYVEDRDLWRFALPDSRAVNAYIAAGDLSLERFASLLVDLATDLPRVVTVGRALESYQQLLAARAAQHAALLTAADGTPWALVNAGMLMSEVGHAVLEAHPDSAWVAVYADDYPAAKRRVSLRGRAGGVDVSRLAQRHGGGGHPSAAGYSIAIGEPVVF